MYVIYDVFILFYHVLMNIWKLKISRRIICIKLQEGKSVSIDNFCFIQFSILETPDRLIETNFLRLKDVLSVGRFAWLLWWLYWLPFALVTIKLSYTIVSPLLNNIFSLNKLNKVRKILNLKNYKNNTGLELKVE